MTIPIDTSVDATGTGGSASASLNHAANALIVISICSKSAPTVITVGGVAATLLTNTGAEYVYYILRASAANETVAVTAGTTYVSVTAISFTGSAQEAPFFEGTGTGTNSVVVGAGTTGRRVILCQAAYQDTIGDGGCSLCLAAGGACPGFTFAPGGSQTNIDGTEISLGSGVCKNGDRYCIGNYAEEVSYRDIDGAVTMTCAVTSSNTHCAAPTNACVAAAIIPVRTVHSTIDIDWVDAYEAVAA